jgi:hypothetical protein
MNRGRNVLLGGIAAAGLVVGLQAPASAAENIHIMGGYGVWSADPSGSNPGDAIKACDTAADGWGIRVTLYTAGSSRTVTTQGHASPYCTGWGTGNLAEGTVVQIRVQQVKTGSAGNTIGGDAILVTRAA